MKKINRIAFIDNDEFTNTYHKNLAERTGISDEVIFFNSSIEALDFLGGISVKSEFPQLIFVDVKMRGTNGNKLISSISELPGFDPLNTVIAFLTNSPDVGEFLKSDDTSVDLYFWKPLKKDVLEKILVEHF